MKALEKTFNGNPIRIIIDKNNKEWFSVYDIGKVLDLKDVQRQARRLPEKGRTFCPTPTKGGVQELMYVDEPNLYRLVFKSKKESAIEFQDWIFEEVIPSIRKTGRYSIPQSMKKISTESRNALTDAWKENGCDKVHHYINLTKEEYKLLGFEKGKKKKDLDRGEFLLLNALESMEMLNLFNNPKKDYYGCKDSLRETVKQLPYDKAKEIVWRMNMKALRLRKI